MHLQSHIMESLASVIYLEYIKMNVPTMTSPIILWTFILKPGVLGVVILDF